MSHPVHRRTRHKIRTRSAVSTADTLHSKGLSAAAQGQHELATSLFSQAIQLSGPTASYCQSLARSLHATGKYHQASICYRQAMAGEPNNIQLHLGLARALFQQTRVDEAVSVLTQTLAARPDVAEGWALLGNALSQSEHNELAREALQKAIALDPRKAGFHYDLGLVLGRTGETRQAELSYRRALQLRRGFPEALNNLGNLLRRRNEAAEAVTYYRQAINHRPGYLDATYNLGLAYRDLDCLEDAERCYTAVLKEMPEHHAAINNLGNVLAGLGKLDQAVAHYDAAVRLAPSSREYRVNLGMAQLLNGDLAAGWRNYAARLAPSRSDLPPWNGESVRDRGILLLNEQGLGDTIQFIRYARLLHQDGGRVSARCPEPMAELLRTAPGINNIVLPGEQPAHCDWYTPLLSLPRLLNTHLENIPAEVPYLFADPERVRDWGVALNIPTSHLRIGVAWRGAAEHWNDRNRSLNPAELSVLDGLPDTTWVSLQKEFPQGCDSLPFTPLPRQLENFADTAALMAHLDLVISVDTSMAHLAGALGRPVWTLLPFAPDWRWLRNRSDSPWYPTMTLFRQERRGEWKPVLEKLREELPRLRLSA